MRFVEGRRERARVFSADVVVQKVQARERRVVVESRSARAPSANTTVVALAEARNTDTTVTT
jgi:hypothetical protein